MPDPGKPYDSFVEDKLGCLVIVMFIAITIGFAWWVAATS